MEEIVKQLQEDIKEAYEYFDNEQHFQDVEGEAGWNEDNMRVLKVGKTRHTEENNCYYKLHFEHPIIKNIGVVEMNEKIEAAKEHLNWNIARTALMQLFIFANGTFKPDFIQWLAEVNDGEITNMSQDHDSYISPK